MEIRKITKRLILGLVVGGVLIGNSALALEIPFLPKDRGDVDLGEWLDPFRKGIPIQVVVDAKFPEVAKLRKIAVPTFGGQLGKDFTASLRDELSSAQVNDKKVFSISGTINSARSDSPKGAVDLAKRAGLDAVYLGETAVAGNRSVPKKREYCKGGVMIFGKCQGGEKISTSCWDVSGTFTVNVQVIRTRDGNTIYEERKSETVTEEHCQAAEANAPEAAALAMQAKDAIVAAIREDIMPRTEIQRVRLMSNTRKMSKEDKATFLEARDWAKGERLGRACGIWEQLSESSEDAKEHPSVIYNLGVCAEYQRDYRSALALYRKADSFVTSKTPGKELPMEGIERVRSAQSAAGR